MLKCCVILCFQPGADQLLYQMTEDHILWEPLSKKVLSSVRYYPSLKNNTILHCRSTMLVSRVWLWPHGLQHTWLPCPSLSPKVCSNSCPSSQWCHPTISFSVVPFSSCLHFFPALGSFPMSELFAMSDQSFGASVSASVLPMNIQDWFPLGWTGWISLQSKGLSRVFSNTTQFKSINSSALTQPSSQSNSHIHVGKVMSLLLNMLSRLVITFLPRSKQLLISWLQSPSAVILEPKK